MFVKAPLLYSQNTHSLYFHLLSLYTIYTFLHVCFYYQFLFTCVSFFFSHNCYILTWSFHKRLSESRWTLYLFYILICKYQTPTPALNMSACVNAFIYERLNTVTIWIRQSWSFFFLVFVKRQRWVEPRTYYSQKWAAVHIWRSFHYPVCVLISFNSLSDPPYLLFAN